MTCARAYTCLHGARTAKRTARTCAIARHTHNVCVQQRQALVALPVWQCGLGGLLVRTHIRFVSVEDGLYRLIVSLSTGTCCVLHGVFIWGRLLFVRCIFGHRSTGLPEKRCPRCTVAAPEVRISSVRSGIWCEFRR